MSSTKRGGAALGCHPYVGRVHKLSRKCCCCCCSLHSPTHLNSLRDTAIGAATPEQVTKDMIAEVAEQDKLLRQVEEVMRIDKPVEEVRY